MKIPMQFMKFLDMTKCNEYAQNHTAQIFLRSNI
jgi:hypothetical protein